MKNDLDKHLRAYQGNNIYDFDNTLMLHWYPQRIIGHAKHARSILELGVGHGFSTELFSKYFSKHVVLEGSPAVIANFKKNFPRNRARIVPTLFEKFDTTEKFDVIVLGFILEHVAKPANILKRYKKFLTPRGSLFVAVPNAEALNRRLGHLAGMLPDIHTLSANDHLLGHKRFFTVKSLTREATQAGCVIKRMEGIYLKPFTTKQIKSLNFSKKVLSAMCEVGIEYPELCCGILAQLKVAR